MIAGLVLALLLGGCGGSGGGSHFSTRRVAGNGFSFSVPVDWKLTRSARQISAAPSAASPELVSVQIFRLRHPARWPRVIPDIDRVARMLTAQLRGVLRSRRTVRAAGVAARQYEIGYERSHVPLTYRITFVLAGRREYQLSCRWLSDSPDPARTACRKLAFVLE